MASTGAWGVDTRNTDVPRTMKPAERPLLAPEVGSGLRARDLWEEASLTLWIPHPWEEEAGGGQHRALWRVSPRQAGSKANAGKRIRMWWGEALCFLLL